MGYDLHKYERFHTFSKVPAGATSELAVAVNKAGHIVQANEVRADAIPYCGIQGSLDAIKTAYATYPNGTLALVRNTDNLYQKTGTDTWQQITIPQEGKFTAITANGQPVTEENPAVLRWHYKVTLSTLNPDNNGQDSNRFSAKYLGVAGVSDAIGQFVTPTDNIYNNAVSGGYDVQIFKNGGTMNKGESEANDQWMDSPYSGMILFMKQQATTDVHKMTCFEYCGRTVSEAMASIKTDAAGGIKGVTAGVGITVDSTTGEGLKPTVTVDTTVIATKKSVDDLSAEVAEKVASVGKDSSSHAALTVTGTATAPTVKLTVDGTVTSGNTGLVTGGTVAKHLTDNTATAIDASSTTGDAKLVTSGAVKTHVTTVAGTTLESAKDYTDDEVKKVTDRLAATGDIGKAIEKAQSDATAAGQAASDAQGDVDALSGEVTTLKGKTLEKSSTGSDYVTVATTGSIGEGLKTIVVTDTGLATKIAALEKADQDNLAEAKKYTTDTIATELGATGSIGAKIKEAKDAADQAKTTADQKVASVTVTDSTGTITSGGTATAPVFTVSGGAITEGKLVTGTTVKTYVEGVAEGLQGSIDAINTSLTTGDIHKEIDAVRTTANEAKTTADTAVQTVTGDTYVKATKSGTEVTLETQLTAIDTALATEGTTLATNIAAAKKAGTDAAAAATKALTDAKAYTDQEVGKVSTALTQATTAHSQDIQTLNAQISAITTSGFERIVVTELPTTDIKLNAIYLIASKESDTNEYIEYIYVGGTVTLGVVSGGKFEQIGTTKTDLAEYAKSVTVNGTKVTVGTGGDVNVGTLVSSVDTTRTDSLTTGSGLVASVETDGTLKIHSAAATDTVLGSVTLYTGELTETAYKAVATSDHNKAASLGSVIGLATRLDGSIATLTADKADKSTTYTKTEVDGIAATKADKSTTYTKTEVDGLLAPKADTETVNAALAKKADADKVLAAVNNVQGPRTVSIETRVAGQTINTIKSGTEPDVTIITQEGLYDETLQSVLQGLDDSVISIEGNKVTTKQGISIIHPELIKTITLQPGMFSQETADMTLPLGPVVLDLPNCTSIIGSGTGLTASESFKCCISAPKLSTGTINVYDAESAMYLIDSLNEDCVTDVRISMYNTTTDIELGQELLREVNLRFGGKVVLM